MTENKKKCVHRTGVDSTLETFYTKHDGVYYCGCRCMVCEAYTDICLTIGEAIARASHEMWLVTPDKKTYGYSLTKDEVDELYDFFYSESKHSKPFEKQCAQKVMRGSTEEEKELYEAMLNGMSSPIDLDIFAKEDTE